MNGNLPDSLKTYFAPFFEKVTKSNEGRVHFMYKEKKDRLILVLHKKGLREIAAKSPDCEKGEYLDWSESEFRDFSPKEAFLKFSEQIDRIIIDDSKFKKSWRSMNDFMSCLDKTLNNKAKKES